MMNAELTPDAILSVAREYATRESGQPPLFIHKIAREREINLYRAMMATFISTSGRYPRLVTGEQSKRQLQNLFRDAFLNPAPPGTVKFDRRLKRQVQRFPSL